MTLAETLLAKLADWRPGAGRQSLSHADASGAAVTCTADRADSLSALVWALEVRRPADAPVPALKAWAEQVAGRVTGLLEPLALYEVDATRNEAVLRSGSPSPRADKLGYYEVRLFGDGRADLRRFQASREPGVHREQVGFALTHEVLAKVAADLLAD